MDSSLRRARRSLAALALLSVFTLSHVGAAEDLRLLPPAAARQRLAALRADVAHHDALYHQKAAPEISDYDYDRLKQRLRELEAAFPELARETPAVAEVGDDRSGLFQTHRHRERMLSLDKTYSEADLRAFQARLAKLLGRADLAYVVEPKFDGFAVSVTYEKGKLVRVVTRGNGVEGDDITANALMIRRLPRGLRATAGDGTANAIPDAVELRGEVYVSFAEFERINAEREAAGEVLFANPRNLATGTIRQLEPKEIERRGLDIVFYGIGACLPASMQPPTQRGLHEMLKRWGLPGVESTWTARGGDELWAAIQALNRARAGFAFPTDGAVVKLDSVAQQREAGATDHAPRWAMAYKFAPARAETQVRAIVVQVGRTGVLTPVVEFSPVELAGSTVARASLHNRDEVARKDIRVGDFVYVEKAGEIIPVVVGVNTARRPAEAPAFVFPATCPACATAVAQRSGEVAVRCPSAACPAQLRRRLEHFASRECVAIDGLGPAMIDALVARGWVKDVPDLYRLRREDLLTLGKDVAKSTDRLLAAIEASKHAELWRFVAGLGIPQVGTVAAKEVARRHGSFDALLSAGASVANDSAGRAIAAYFAEPRNRALVENLIAAGVRPAGAKTEATGARLAGKIFVLTGTLPSLTRAQATEKIIAAGGRVAGSVSRNTHYLVLGADPGAKLDQAHALGVKVIDEPALLRLLRDD
ncbi:MAG: NAD-dependent DNA ligase LigA [Verrucomicrobia bacterium]|nr:NAD-dependent DNA ligase LigA [Verrucomicrobiota bacterium]